MQEYQLVPKQMVNMLGQANQMQITPNLDSVIKLDNEMEKILNNKNLTIDQKYAQYQEILERYLTYRRKETQQSSHPITIQDSNIKRNVEDEILQLLPSKGNVKNKATQLMNILKTKPNIINWDEDGKLYYKNNLIPNSNIGDIIYDLVNPYSKNRNPIGILHVQKALEEINIPQAMIVNVMRKPSNRNIMPSKSQGTSPITMPLYTQGTSTIKTRSNTRSTSPIDPLLLRGRTLSKSPAKRRRGQRSRSPISQRGEGLYNYPKHKWIPYN